MKFTVEIQMEAGMQTPADVAQALHDTAVWICDNGMPIHPPMPVRDYNENVVGQYSLTAE